MATNWFRIVNLFDEDVAIGDFDGGAAVDLQADDAALGDVGFGFGVVDGLDVVHPDLDAGAFAADAEVVPAGGFDGG